jgi:hypothetical protein
MSAEQDLKVFISSRESTCDECGQVLGRSAWICLLGERGALCLSSQQPNPSACPTSMRARAALSATPSVVLNWTRSMWEGSHSACGNCFLAVPRAGSAPLPSTLV